MATVDPRGCEATPDPVLADPRLVPWLARHTATAERVVMEELELAAARRAFVVDELLDAGFSEEAVLDGTIRLTGLAEADARKLIRARSLARARWVEVDKGIYRHQGDLNAGTPA